MPLTETDRPSMVPKKIREQNFFRLLSHLVNPDTHKLYTAADLAGLSKPKRSKTTIQSILDGTISQFSPPEIKEVELTGAEKAFFMGLALGFNVEQTAWNKKEYVVITTYSRDPKKKALIKDTIGTKGVIRDFPTQTKVYLSPSSFDFLLKEKPTADFFHAKRRFAPFLFGLMAGALSEKKNQITLADSSIYEKIINAFNYHYGFQIGYIKTDNRSVHSDFLYVRSPKQVLSTLLMSKDVQSLPFLRALSYPSPIE
ncbi:MAG: hypothetical protein Q7S38_00230 [bacterium]|nr:hypothetical protein [bacterium]